MRKEVGDGGHFAQVVGLKAHGEARPLADGSVHRQVGLRRAEIALGQRQLLILAGVGGVNRAVDGDGPREQARRPALRDGCPVAWPLMVASALAIRSSNVFPQDAFASAFSSPVRPTLPVEAEGPIMARDCGNDTPRIDAVASEWELPPMSFMVPCAVISPPSTLARKSCSVALPLASE